MFEKIVVPVDGSVPSSRAVPAAADLAKKYGSEIVLVHIREFEVSRGVFAKETPKEALEFADQIAKDLKDQGIKVRVEVRSATSGHAAHEIMEVADKEAASLIVMGTRGLSDWSGMLVGSVAHKVIHMSKVPVLTVR
jgi:nucleotide-binding universal stress UspA family protein